MLKILEKRYYCCDLIVSKFSNSSKFSVIVCMYCYIVGEVGGKGLRGT